MAAWVSGRFVFENYATRKRVAAAPMACQVLDFFSDWHTAPELSHALPHYEEKSLARAVRQLAQVTLLQCSNRPEHPIEKNIPQWKHWNPAGSYFHFSTKDGAYDFDASPGTEATYFRELAARSAMPSSVKRHPDAPLLPMLAPSRDSEFSQVLLSRRTWREFSTNPICYEDLSTLFWFTFRVQGWFDFYSIGKLACKTSPSGGARHPIEAYLLALKVEGLQRGVYHYAADTHELEWLRDLPRKRFLQSLTPTQGWWSDAAAMVLLTAVFARDYWKYPLPRAYRAVLIDAGHLCQTFCLTATWLGLAPFCTMALADSKIEHLLSIDGVSEGAIYLAGVGSRPKNASAGEDILPNPWALRGEHSPGQVASPKLRSAGRNATDRNAVKP